MVGALQTRTYILYICETQDAADKHLETINTMLTDSPELAATYPALCRPRLKTIGPKRAQAWRHNRLVTDSGLVIDALGLDVSVRGIKFGRHRPDMMLFDDIDSLKDGPDETDRKLDVLANTVLPAGDDDLTVVGLQNLIHVDSIFSRLAGRSSKAVDILGDRIVSGPHKAIEGMELETTTKEEHGRLIIQYRIVKGTATWAGQSIDICERKMNSTEGRTAFLREHQQEVSVAEGGLFNHLPWDAIRISFDDFSRRWVDMVRVVVWVDPAVSETKRSDCQACIVASIDTNGTIYLMWGWEQVASPLVAMQTAIRKAVEAGAHHVGIETNQGGDLWANEYRQAAKSLKLPIGTRIPDAMGATAGTGTGGKLHRAGITLSDFERGGIRIVEGTHETIENALKRFPKVWPLDLVDAIYWAVSDLRRNASLQLLADAIEVAVIGTDEPDAPLGAWQQYQRKRKERMGPYERGQAWQWGEFADGEEHYEIAVRE